MAKNSRRSSRSNNPEGRNQYSNGWMDSVRERPLAAAATAAAAVGAGVFLWSKRAMISEQLGQLGEQISSWRDEMLAQNLDAEAAGDAEPFIAKPAAKRSTRKSQAQIAEEALTLKETGEPAPTGL